MLFQILALPVRFFAGLIFFFLVVGPVYLLDKVEGLFFESPQEMNKFKDMLFDCSQRK